MTSSGAGGKCLNSDSLLTVSGGSIIAKATGGVCNYTSTAYGPGGDGFPGGGGGFPGGGTTDTSKKSSPKAIKSDGDMLFSGGTIDATSSSSEAIESKSCITIVRPDGSHCWYRFPLAGLDNTMKAYFCMKQRYAFVLSWDNGLSLLPLSCYALHLNERALGQVLYGNCRAAWVWSVEEFGIHLVHGGKIAHV